MANERAHDDPYSPSFVGRTIRVDAWLEGLPACVAIEETEQDREVPCSPGISMHHHFAFLPITDWIRQVNTFCLDGRGPVLRADWTDPEVVDCWEEWSAVARARLPLAPWGALRWATTGAQPDVVALAARYHVRSPGDEPELSELIRAVLTEQRPPPLSRVARLRQRLQTGPPPVPTPEELGNACLAVVRTRLSAEFGTTAPFDLSSLRQYPLLVTQLLACHEALQEQFPEALFVLSVYGNSARVEIVTTRTSPDAASRWDILGDRTTILFPTQVSWDFFLVIEPHSAPDRLHRLYAPTAAAWERCRADPALVADLLAAVEEVVAIDPPATESFPWIRRSRPTLALRRELAGLLRTNLCYRSILPAVPTSVWNGHHHLAPEDDTSDAICLIIPDQGASFHEDAIFHEETSVHVPDPPVRACSRWAALRDQRPDVIGAIVEKYFGYVQ